ncbi:MAG: hypothetical protein Q8O52_21075 [Sulfuritalea sp.]|nr:hypothetical protein [Sulfuritalea sp.]
MLQIVPLDRSRVETYAREKGGLNDPQDFVAALDKQHAWAFARRPVDVIPLFNYWNDRYRLGTLTELIEYGLHVSLAETENREKADVLSRAEARQGAEALAAAATFCKQYKFAVPDSGFVADAGALDVTSCLPVYWKPDMRRALLTRAVFDAATYGHIRFHHREVLDFLAASWLAGLMNADCSLDALEDLLFQVREGRRVLRPSLAPLAAWMAPGDEPWRGRLREWIRQSAPELLLQHGDGAGLPLAYRRQILSAIVSRYQGRERVMLSWSAEALSRLASPELSDDVNAILGNDSVAEDLKEDMLSLARHGAIHGCIPVAIDIAAMNEASDSLKSYAVALVRDIGNAADRARLAAVVKQQSRFTTILCGRLCEALYPAALDAKGIASLLERTDEVGHYSVDLPYYLKAHFETHLTTERALAMLEEMLRLLGVSPLDNDIKLSKRFLWTANLLPVCLKKLLAQTRLDGNQLEAASRAISVLEKAGRYSLLDGGFSRKSSESQDIAALLARHPKLKRQVFWNRCRRWKEKHGSYPRWYMPLELGNIELGLSASDVGWLNEDACDTNSPPEERAFAARAFLNMQASLPEFLRRTVCLLRGGAMDLRAEVWRALRLRLTGPFMAFWYRQVIGKLADRYWWKHRYWDFQHRYEHLREQWMFHRRSHWLRTGKRWDWLAHLVNEAEPSLTNRSPQSWAPLQEKRGKRIAEAVRVGCETFWSSYSPLLPHEKPARNETDARVIVGLAGLQSLWQRGALDFSRLSDAEIQRATRYGCEELNGLPEWFFALGQARPEAWLDVLFEAVRGEWATPSEQEHVNDVVAKLVWHGRPYWPVFAPGFLELLDKSDPPHPRVLEYALTILLGGMMDVSRLTELARKRIADYGYEDRQFVLWLSVWMQIDASATLDYLDHVLASMPPVQADDLTLRLCASMKQDRHDPSLLLAQPDYTRAEALGRFIRLAYQHVRPEQDIHRAGKGVYSPGPRDHAQEFRSKLFELLSGSDQPEADAVLRSLLDAPELKGQRDWILHLLDKRVERAADFEPWRQTEVQAFAQDHEIAPRSAYALFRIACRRFWDIKKEVEGVEYSLRNAVRPGDDESVMQQWL